MYEIIGVGHSCRDMLCTVENYPKEDDSTHITSINVQGGGAVATAMVAASRLGLKVAFVGNVGNDAVSDEIVRLFETDGVATEFLFRRQDCHGLESFVMVNPANGSRTKFPQRDFNPPIEWDDTLKSAIGKAKILHLDGTNYENAINAAEIAKSYGVTVSLDGCSMQTDNRRNRTLASMADILIMNRKYPLMVAEKADYEEALLEMASWGPKIVVCTLGENGSLAVVDKKVCHFMAIKPEKVVDTTGCGDVFHGAFLCAHVLGMNLEKAIGFASAAASIKCTKSGGRAGISFKDEVLKKIGN